MTSPNGITLESLGLTQDALIDRLVEQLAGGLLDEDGSDFSLRLRKKVEQAVDAKVQQIAAEHIEPRVASLIDNMTFQESNQWGEAKKPPMTYREYLVSRAEAWCEEPVNYEGKTKRENNWSSFNAKSSRLAYMVDSHLHYEIERSVKAALEDANSKIAGGIVAAVKTSLSNALTGLKASVSVK